MLFEREGLTLCSCFKQFISRSKSNNCNTEHCLTKRYDYKIKKKEWHNIYYVKLF